MLISPHPRLTFARAAKLLRDPVENGNDTFLGHRPRVRQDRQ